MQQVEPRESDACHQLRILFRARLFQVFECFIAISCQCVNHSKVGWRRGAAGIKHKLQISLQSAVQEILFLISALFRNSFTASR